MKRGGVHPILVLTLKNATLALVYVGAARVGLELDAVSGFATLVWPPTGIALAALLLQGFRLWPGVAIGAFVVNLWVGAAVPVAAGIATGNTLEAVVGAFALTRLGFRPALDRARDVAALIVAALGATLLSATIGVASLLVGGLIPAARFVPTWSAWWLGDLLGALVVAPLVLSWSANLRIERAPIRIAEAVALMIAIAALSQFVFGGWFPGATNLRQEYLLFPLLIWAAVRFDQRAVTTSTFVASALAIWGTAHGLGPFIEPTLRASLSSLQAFMAIVATTALVMGAVFSERRQAVRARDEFLSVASHELRTPLSALVLQLGTLQRRVPRDARSNLPGSVDKAVKTTDRLTRLVDSLLDVSRIESGRMQLRLEPCDLCEVARDAVERVSDEARRAGCELRLDADRPVRGAWDLLRVEQVFANLLSNAIKYGRGKPIDVVVWREDGVAKLSVRDHGIGIARSDVDRVFARFERAVTTRQYGGLGLGLYIARQIVQAHGGSIAATGEPGEGARFVVELPIERDSR